MRVQNTSTFHLPLFNFFPSFCTLREAFYSTQLSFFDRPSLTFFIISLREEFFGSSMRIFSIHFMLSVHTFTFQMGNWWSFSFVVKEVLVAVVLRRTHLTLLIGVALLLVLSSILSVVYFRTEKFERKFENNNKGKLVVRVHWMRENQPPWSVQLTIDPRGPEKNLSFMTELDASM